jgi:hypothetical protein
MGAPLPEWLEEFRDLPSAWDPPEELAVPTHSPGLNLALIMLASRIIGNDLAELVGLWIAAGPKSTYDTKESWARGLPLVLESVCSLSRVRLQRPTTELGVLIGRQ